MFAKKTLAILSCAALAAASTLAFAEAEQNYVIAPTCLLQSANLHANALAVKHDLQLLAVNENELDQLAVAKHLAKTGCGGFINVSDEWIAAKKSGNTNAFVFLSRQLTTRYMQLSKPAYVIQYQPQTTKVLKNINPQNMWTNLTTLTGFKDRSASSENGVEAAAWIKNKIESIAKETGHENDVTVYYVPTGKYEQPSVVAKFGNGDEPGVVLGAHMDTLKSILWFNFPGADDDGSGTVTLMETARTLLASGQQFKKPIYFIWYSAEEKGLVGSKYVVADFTSKKIPVAAALQMDMTGYEHNNEPTMWLMTDYVDPDLTAYVETLIKTYVKKPFDTSACGYGCSDHVSWFNAKVPAVMPFEAKMHEDDPEIHTSKDKMELLSLDHMTDFAKLGTAFAVELAEPAN